MTTNQNVLVTAVLVVVVVGRFLARELRERRFDVRRIYVAPAILGAIAVGLAYFALQAEPRANVSLAVAAIAALVVGAGIGYAVAHFTTVRVVEQPHVLFARGSYATVAIWVAALALRLVGRYAIATGGPATAGMALALDAALVLLLASALFFVRYRLLVAARIERARGITTAISAV